MNISIEQSPNYMNRI